MAATWSITMALRLALGLRLGGSPVGASTVTRLASDAGPSLSVLLLKLVGVGESLIPLERGPSGRRELFTDRCLRCLALVVVSSWRASRGAHRRGAARARVNRPDGCRRWRRALQLLMLAWVPCCFCCP